MIIFLFFFYFQVDFYCKSTSFLGIRRKIRLRSMIGYLANEAIILWQVTYAAEKKPGQDFVPMINLLLPAKDFVPMINLLLPATLQPELFPNSIAFQMGRETPMPHI